MKSGESLEIFIRFKQGDLQILRESLLDESPKEAFAILLAKSEKVNGLRVIKVLDVKRAGVHDYQSQSKMRIELHKGFIRNVLVEATSRLDVDTIIDVHTHPFTEGRAWFSPMDDRDEMNFAKFVGEHFDLEYASIVFSQKSYTARLWQPGGRSGALSARLQTQTPIEVPHAFHQRSADSGEDTQRDFLDIGDRLNRSALALGVESMRRITGESPITLVGLGGIGSIISEHLVHMGFGHINLIDPDHLEVSNLNRIVGVSYNDAVKGLPKVEVVKRHLLSINPSAHIHSFSTGISDPEMEEVIARSAWVIVSSDTHSSRLATQRISLKYFVPMISVGVGIEVGGDTIRDMSGEVITVRAGDGLCLSCLGRIDPTRIAHETHPDIEVRNALVKRGYVSGADVKDPAVKTLNAMVATMAVEILVNQFTGRQRHRSVMIYENNGGMSIYEDRESIERRPKRCFSCDL